jgi:rSAM/selenodomain-associated transferase 1
MTGHPTLLVFLKHPEPGRVKTRLARMMGVERAAALYGQWIGTVLDRFQPLRPAVRVVGYFDGAGAEAFWPWHSLADEWWPQPAGDLGDRLTAGFAKALESGRPALAVGTDCLEITPELVNDAVEHLAQHDVVFGPSWDGGYYLIGTTAARAGLFQSVRWSTEFTLADHLDRCREADWSVAFLPKLHDIDTWDDWQAYLVRTGRQSGEPHTDAGGDHSLAE